MAGNKEIIQLPIVPDPNGSAVYVVKTGVDYQAPVGGANGLVYTDAGTKVPVALIPNLPAAQITSGTFANAQIAAGNVTQHQAALSIAWGQLTSVPATFTPSAHVHATTDITSGTFANARIAAGNVTQHQAALSIGWAQLTSIPAFATRWADWTEVTNKPATFSPSAHTHAASDITSGVFATARLGTGVANTTVFLRGDGTWAATPSAGSPAWGDITGTLSNQTDLQNSLNAKANTSNTVTTDGVQTISGAKTFTNLDVTGTFGRKNANSATITNQPRHFVQSTDPGAAAADGDIWTNTT